MYTYLELIDINLNFVYKFVSVRVALINLVDVGICLIFIHGLGCVKNSDL